LEKGLARLVQGFVDLLLTVWFKCFQHFSGGWINGLNAHNAPPFENKKRLGIYYTLNEGSAAEMPFASHHLCAILLGVG
jgi:hypothetical protein